MSKEDKKLQKHLVDEMMKVYETNLDVMLYMQSLMENYEKLEQENKQLKSILTELEEWLKEQGNNGIDEWGNHYSVCLYKLNMLKEKYKNV